MRFLHTSDWHLGRQFHNVPLLEDQRYILSKLLDIAREEQVEAIFVAGDLYDRSVPPAEAVALLDEVIHRVRAELKVPLVMIAGNHDSGARTAFAARELAMAQVHITGNIEGVAEPIILSDEHGDVAVYSLPFVGPSEVREAFALEVHSQEQAISALVDEIHAAHRPGLRCIVLSHCFVSGGETSESERPLSVGGADQVSESVFERFDYAALGHLHRPQHRSREVVRYSGSLLKYSFSETLHEKGVSIVDMDAHGQCKIRHVSLIPRRDVRILEGSLDSILAGGAEKEGKNDYLLVRLEDTQAILDVMGKLRAVYPNVLHVERTGLMKQSETRVRADRLNKGELEMFEAFWKNVHTEQLSEEERSQVSRVISQVHHEDGS